ncbi:MAG: protein kinase [Prevotellaceae bacterium]|jgi:hypothetical protein|nr:protein kinase [Prevotellaceae bacterium]
MELREYNKFHNDRYELVRRIGGGGFSEVWLARDTKANDMEVALKIYASLGGLDDEGVTMFSNEFSLLVNYNHSNLLKPMHFDEHENRPYLVMQFCESGSAKRFIGEITEEAAWQLLHDVSAGLAYLHSREVPVIHQDIKPDNILISSQGEFLITDFGISTQARSTLRKSAINVSDSASGGSPDYMGPERFSSDNKPVKASDIWALGATMYELLEGRLPFPNGLGGLAQKGGADIPQITGKYSKTLKELIYKMLAKETWDRPTAEVIKQQTEEHLIGGKGKKSKKLLIVLGSLLAAVVIAVGAIVLFGKERILPPPPPPADVAEMDFYLHGRHFVYTGAVKRTETGELIPNGIGSAVYDAGDVYISEEDVVSVESFVESGDTIAVIVETPPDCPVMHESICTYEGRFLNGYREGPGKLTYQGTADTYDGQFHRDFFQGKGIYIWDDGNSYNGSWKDNNVWDGTITDKKGNPKQVYQGGKCVWGCK